MSYTIHNLTYESHDTDEELIFFNFDIHFTEPGPLVVEKYFYPCSAVMKLLQQQQPGFYEYINKVREGLDTWGPAEHSTLEAMGDEARQQLLHFVQACLEQADWVPELYEWRLRMMNMSTATAANMESKVGKLQASASNLKVENKRGKEFKTRLQRQMRELTLELYPEILEASGENLKKFQYLFVNDILNVEKTLYRFLKEIE